VTSWSKRYAELHDSGPIADRSLQATSGSWRQHVRHFASLDFVVPALIGMISLTGALLAWQIVLHTDRAAEADRRLALERSLETNALVGVEIDVRGHLDRDALMLVEQTLATSLEESAGTDDGAVDGQLRAEARELRRVAAERLNRRNQVVDGYNQLMEDENALRAGLLAQYEGLIPPSPNAFRATADDERDTSTRSAALVIVLAIAGLIGTLAHITRTKAPKVALTIGCSMLWAAALISVVSWRT
jgi:hypothetical protein